MITMLCVAFTFDLWSRQPYYSTRVNAADIESRVKQLDLTTQQQQEGEGEKSKAGFWEEFDVRFDLAVAMVTLIVYRQNAKSKVAVRKIKCPKASL